jgi:hypothetical protein
MLPQNLTGSTLKLRSELSVYSQLFSLTPLLARVVKKIKSPVNWCEKYYLQKKDTHKMRAKIG